MGGLFNAPAPPPPAPLPTAPIPPARAFELEDAPASPEVQIVGVVEVFQLSPEALIRLKVQRVGQKRLHLISPFKRRSPPKVLRREGEQCITSFFKPLSPRVAASRQAAQASKAGAVRTPTQYSIPHIILQRRSRLLYPYHVWYAVSLSLCCDISVYATLLCLSLIVMIAWNILEMK